MTSLVDSGAEIESKMKDVETDSDQAEEVWACSVCGGTDGYDDNPIVGCDGCEMAVHKECYGFPLVSKIPDGDWLCERCMHDANQECCILCGESEGAMKRTTDWKWAHLSCALWIPEVFFRIGEGQEPVDYFQTPRERWQQQCFYCKGKAGVCIECSEEKCGTTFHVTCGMKRNIHLDYKPMGPGHPDVVVSFCVAHSKRWQGKKSVKCVIRAV